MSRQVPKSLLLRQARRLSPATLAPPPTLTSLLSQFTLLDNQDETTIEEQFDELRPLLVDISDKNIPFDNWTSTQINLLKHHLDTISPLSWNKISDQDKKLWYLLGYGAWGPRREFSEVKPNDIQWDSPSRRCAEKSEIVKRVNPIVLCSKDRLDWAKERKQLDPVTLSVGLFASVISVIALLV